MSTLLESTTNTPSQTEAKAQLQEVFSSIQGEGPYVGKRQIFVRFNACHLKCAYCDSPPHAASAPCIVTSPGHVKETVENPVTLSTLMTRLLAFTSEAKHHSISFTGGEPLLYTAFLKQLLPEVSMLLPVYLETSGTQPEKLTEILPWITYIAMDIKLPSATKEPMQVENHRAFYQAARGEDLFVKLVFNAKTTPQELDAVFEIVTDTQAPLILQPETDLLTGKVAVSPEQMYRLSAHLEQVFSDVRVIAQTHKMLAVL